MDLDPFLFKFFLKCLRILEENFKSEFFGLLERLCFCFENESFLEVWGLENFFFSKIFFKLISICIFLDLRLVEQFLFFFWLFLGSFYFFFKTFFLRDEIMFVDLFGLREAFPFKSVDYLRLFNFWTLNFFFFIRGALSTENLADSFYNFTSDSFIFCWIFL